MNESSAQSGGVEIPADFMNWIKAECDAKGYNFKDGMFRHACEAAYRHLSTHPTVVDPVKLLKWVAKVAPPEFREDKPHTLKGWRFGQNGELLSTEEIVELYNKTTGQIQTSPPVVEGGLTVKKIIPNGNYFVAQCPKCGFKGSSGEWKGGGQIADTGDYGDAYCPVCGGKECDEAEDDAYIDQRDLFLKKIAELEETASDLHWKLLQATQKPAIEPSTGMREVICPACGGDGKETCNNPDHSFIEAMPGETGRLGCPVCGHDPNHKVNRGRNTCDLCGGHGHVAFEVFDEYGRETGYDEEPIAYVASESPEPPTPVFPDREGPINWKQVPGNEPGEMIYVDPQATPVLPEVKEGELADYKKALEEYATTEMVTIAKEVLKKYNQ